MKILIIVYSYIKRDVRVLKQIEWLKQHDVTLMAFGEYTNSKVKYIELKDYFPLYIKLISTILLKLKLYNLYYWILPTNKDALTKSKSISNIDLIIANDIYTLPLAVKIKKDSKLLYDAHEYYPKEHDNNKMWMFFFHDYMNYLTKKYASKADRMLTIGEAIKREYTRIFTLNPTVVMNMPKYEEIEIKQNDNKEILMVHHGAALPGRNLELMIEIVNILGNNYYLDFYLVKNNAKYVQSLKELIKDNKNIRILDPVSVDKISHTLSQYDIGFYFLKSDSFNDIFCLPNKLFDFIQARLAVIIGPSPEMKRIIEEYQCGYATKDFELNHIVQEIKNLSKDDLNRFKQNSDKAAKILNADTSKKVFLSIIHELTDLKNKG
jgi:hypothetical protein